MHRLPTNQQRISIIGKTGSGKTHAGLWHLSMRDFKIPFVVIDTKNDDLFYEIPHAKIANIHTRFNEGLYILPVNIDEIESIEPLFYRIWETQNTGIFIDEALDIGKFKSYHRLIRQGRSKNIPIIQLMQRPAGVNRLVISEAEYFQIFEIVDEADKDRIMEFVPLPRAWKEEKQSLLESHTSFYYDVAQDKLVKINPLPELDEIMETLNDKLKKRIVYL